uniref:Uncharacterized protein n=1 Tax=viral metagenome TaxID=1070528 RepID=A0A6C0KSS5_9ZZZZ
MKIAILLSGQLRKNGFNINNDHSNDILESWNQFLFTQEFRKNNTFDIYISTDENSYNINKIQDFFGNNSKIIIAQDVEPGIIGFTKESLKRPNRYPKSSDNDISDLSYYSRPIWQWYRLYLAWYSMNKTNIEYDIIIRLRPDTIFLSSCESIFNNIIINNDVELYMCWDIFAVGKKYIMAIYCNLIKYIGEYIPGNIKYSFKNNGLCSYNTYYDVLLKEVGYKFSPETQLLEHLMYWIVHEKKLNIDKIVRNAMDIKFVLEKNKNEYNSVDYVKYRN